MNAFLMTVYFGFKHYIRDRSSVFWGMVFPLLLMGLIGLAFGRGGELSFRVGFVGSGGPVAEGLRQGLGGVVVFRVTDERDEAAALEELRRGRRTLVVVVPPPGSPGPLRVYFDRARVQESQTALVILERFVAEANLRLAGVPPLVRIEALPTAASPRLRFFDFLLPGILAMTVMNTGLNGVTWVMTAYRKELILKRVLTTPVHPFAFIGGLVARWAVTNLFQLAVIMAVAILAFHATVVGSLWTIAALAVLGTLAFVGMGFAISAVSKTPESASLLGSVLSFPMMFLAGTFWPREFMPAFLQPVISALPLTPLVEAMRGVAARGEPAAAYLPGLLYIAAWGLASFLVAAWRFRWE
ncbi:MAG: ABC transporter permease [Armatimonadota bacterium]|nr:ABC transporter permease [Armatimonadota bacterium]MDR7450688.1 ABC transporter permease [Armatimonadota bacterium]MDR7466044.1 ABC transporter permease [Armatimonadota bacterium]MDR7493919.1 ABC transporter permease [Armatimonadota bacterium]MDR7504024.1 ABC transporter permease [Armatimonadota bacterium]